MNQDFYGYQKDIHHYNPYGPEECTPFTRLCVYNNNFMMAKASYGYLSSDTTSPFLFDAYAPDYDVNKVFPPLLDDSITNTFLSHLSSLNLNLSNQDLGDIFLKALEQTDFLNCTIGIGDASYDISIEESSMGHNETDSSARSLAAGSLLRMILERNEAFILLLL